MTGTVTVIGGSYGEDCGFPRRKIFRGSGQRAANVLASLCKPLGTDVTLMTAVGPELTEMFSGIAKTGGYKLESWKSAVDIWFRYNFPLSQPYIYPENIPTALPDGVLVADAALAFGMMEGRPVLHGKRVVYDPQDGHRATAYASNGSTAEDLAVIVSYSEGRAITGEQDPVVIASLLLKQPNAKVAIIKCGPQGAYVHTATSSSWVHSFPTDSVYKIGSGDVFSAAFAFSWLVESVDAVDAAWFASRMTAAYVETSQDRFSVEQLQAIKVAAAERRRTPGASHPRAIPDKQIYLAGPFFNTAQQWLITEVRNAILDMGFKVFSPIHDVGEGLPEEVAPRDLAGLEASCVILAILDGLDAGTLFEVGYARSKNIPVVCVAESVETGALTMLIGTECRVTYDLTSGIYAACWKVMGDA